MFGKAMIFANYTFQGFVNFCVNHNVTGKCIADLQPVTSIGQLHVQNDHNKSYSKMNLI